MNLDMNGLKCFECDEVAEEPAGVEDNEECMNCGSENTKAVKIEDCPVFPKECHDPNHHFGIAKHVIDPDEEE